MDTSKLQFDCKLQLISRSSPRAEKMRKELDIIHSEISQIHNISGMLLEILNGH